MADANDSNELLTPEQLAQRLASKPTAAAPGAPTAVPTAAPTSPAEAHAAPAAPPPAAPEQVALGASPKNMGWVPWLAEQGLSAGLGGVGATLGALSPVPGGALAGEAGGLTLGDFINAKINRYAYGTQAPDLSFNQMAKDYALNFGGALGGRAIGKGLGWGWRAITSQPEMAEAAKTAASKAETLISGAKQSMVESEQQHAQATRTAIDKAREQLLGPSGEGSLIPEARTEAIQREMGRTPEETRAAIYGKPDVAMGPAGMAAQPSDAVTARRMRFFDAFYGGETRNSRLLGQQFEDLFAPHVANEVDATSIANRARELTPNMAPGVENYAQTYQPQYSAGTQRLLGEANQFLPKQFDPNTPFGRWATSIGLQQEPRTPIGDLLGYRTRLGDALATSGGPDRAVLTMMRRSVDDVLGESGVPGARELRAKYAGFMKDFDPAFLHQIGRTSEPSAAMGAILDKAHPQRALLMMEGATDAERQTWRHLYGDAVNNGYLKPDKSQAAALQAMGFQGLLKDPDSWAFNQKMVPQLRELFNKSPEAGTKLIDRVNDVRVGMEGKEWQGVVEDARKLTETMGDAGQRVNAAIDAAPTARGKAVAALQGFGMLQPGQEGTAAGVQALLNFQPKEGTMWNRLKWRAFNGLMLGTPISAMGLAMGHPYMGAGLAIGGILTGGIVGAGNMLSAAYRWNLQRGGTAAAEAMFNAIKNPGVRSSLDTFARSIVQAGLDNAVSGAAQRGLRAAGVETSVTPPPPAPPESLTPFASSAVPEMERKSAQQIAGANATPERVDTIQDVSHQLAQGKTPRIGTALRSGQLSTPAVKQMLARMNPRNATSMLKMMGPDDRQHLLALANPEEREWLDPYTRAVG